VKASGAGNIQNKSMVKRAYFFKLFFLEGIRELVIDCRKGSKPKSPVGEDKKCFVVILGIKGQREGVWNKCSCKGK